MIDEEAEDPIVEASEKSPYRMSQTRALRFSSNAKENSIKSLEKMLFLNMCMHDQYKVSLDNPLAFEYAAYINDKHRALGFSS
jgi:hypothetical protein